MKTPILTAAVALAIAGPSATLAQTTGQATAKPPQFSPPPVTTSRGLFGRSAPKPKATTGGAASAEAPRDPNVLRTGESIPDPVPVDEIHNQNLPPLAEPIENYLLQKEHGPFMVAAYTYRGPDAAKQAQILATELRKEYGLPAFIWLARVQPYHSNIQGIQPTAPPHARNGDLAPPERYRMYDEAAVLVGNCKTIDESEKLLHQVKKIRPECLYEYQNFYLHRRGKGLSRAMLTTNPFQASQNLFPGTGPRPAGMPAKQGEAFDPWVVLQNYENTPKVDDLIRRINKGPYSIFKNPSEYTLQVAEFGGRIAVMVSSEKGKGDAPVDESVLRGSPLASAADDAEKLADALNKCKSLGGVRAYAYHSRTSSFVTIGGFNSPQDPAQDPVRKRIDAVSNELIKRSQSQIALRPAAVLMRVPKDNQ